MKNQVFHQSRILEFYIQELEKYRIGIRNFHEIDDGWKALVSIYLS